MGPEPDRKGRQRGIRAGFQKLRIDALLVTDINNIRYMSGFTGSDAYILMTGDRAFFLTDPRYSLQARREVDARLFSIRIYKNRGLSEVSSLINKIKPSAVGFEGASLAYDDYARVKKALKGIRLCPASGIIRKVRARKDPFEVGR
ncbi:MAG: aminopeptidase P family N-terminal domain-containing protein, partial [Deltaproteobacteria bacterium]|nr:aminopeptidase P family N-terminal domain-containing protein [Deltaproteobacteria bacterium]